MDETSDSSKTAASQGAGDAHDLFGERFAAVMQPPEVAPVDLAAYLLDPPPTAAEHARADQRRRRVRVVSLVAAGLLAVVLLAPMPGDGNADPDAASRDPARTGVVADDTLYPQRVDQPTAEPAPRAVAARKAAPRVTPAPSVTRRDVARSATATRGASRPTARPVTRSPSRTPTPPKRPAASSGAGSASAGGGGAGATATSAPVPAAGGATTSSDAPTNEDGVGTSRAGPIRG